MAEKRAGRPRSRWGSINDELGSETRESFELAIPLPSSSRCREAGGTPAVRPPSTFLLSSPHANISAIGVPWSVMGTGREPTKRSFLGLIPNAAWIVAWKSGTETGFSTMVFDNSSVTP